MEFSEDQECQMLVIRAAAHLAAQVQTTASNLWVSITAQDNMPDLSFSHSTSDVTQ